MRYHPVVNRVLPRHPKVRLKRIDVNQDPRHAMALGIRSIPTSFLLGPDGAVLEEFGYRNELRLGRLLERHGY